MAEPTKTSGIAVIILAAGKGTRMKNPDVAKVMFDVHGKPMIGYAVELAAKLQAARTMLVVGWQKQSVIDFVSTAYPGVEIVDQEEQRGTGHAVMQTVGPLKEFDGDLLLLSGDVPLLTEKTAKALLGYHRMSDAAATILTAELPDPTGYGRIVRNDDGSVKKIVEQKEGSPQELAIREINSGSYVFDKQRLFDCLPQLSDNNAPGEYYLTDVFELYWKNNWRVSAVKVIDPIEVMGINDSNQLEIARDVMASRTAP